jgi:hypothetical protein
MHVGVTSIAKRDQILGYILAGVAAELFVVNLKVRHRAARLAFPPIASEHLMTKLFI